MQLPELALCMKGVVFLEGGLSKGVPLYLHISIEIDLQHCSMIR